jgi:hypothetical protein
MKRPVRGEAKYISNGAACISLCIPELIRRRNAWAAAVDHGSGSHRGATAIGPSGFAHE